MNKYTLFVKVENYYADLVVQLATSQNMISMTYLAFDNGIWADQITKILVKKALSGICVRLMVDELGQIFDEPHHLVENKKMFEYLQSYGIQVDFFRPASPLHINNRLHCKFAAIDDRMVFLGGSNIGDYYTTWTDTNLRVDGDLGDTFHRVYNYLRGHSKNGEGDNPLDINDIWAGGDQLFLTVPHRQFDIREKMMDLIKNAEKSIYIRTWYFLPDKEMLDALCEKARHGVRVNILLSHETRVRPVDFANYIHVHKLVCAGGNVYRYKSEYMHSKVAWSDDKEVLFGSANMDAHSMRHNFESCLNIHDRQLVRELRSSFYADLAMSSMQTPESYRQRSLAGKALSNACSLASPWL